MITLLLKKFNKAFSFRLNSSLLVLLFGLLVMSNAFSQTVAGSYVFSQVDTGLSYSPITGAGSSPGVVTPVGYTTNLTIIPAATTIPFNFNFNGTVYTSTYISDNGFITFGASPALTYYTPISGATGSGAISAFGCNLQAASTNTNYALPPASEVRYETQGVAPNRVFIVQYSNVVRKTLTQQNGLLNFQIRLYETTNLIETVYDVFNPSSPVTAASLVVGQQVGLRGANNSDFNNRVPTTTNSWLNTAAGITNADSMSLSSTIFNSTVTKFVWTPCYLPTALAAVMQANNTTVNLTWTEPIFAPSNYNYEVRTSGLPGSGAAGLFASGTLNSPVSSLSVPGLVACVNYTIYLRSNCRNDWSKYISTTIAPAGSTATIPYSQDFESVTAPAIPTCNFVQMVTGANMVTLNNTATALYGFNNKNLATSGNLAMDSWYFTQKINFPIAGSYRLSYKYGGTRESAFFIQKMRVAYGPNAAATAAGMTGGTIIADHNSIKLSPLTNVINFTVAAPGVYYVGFQGYADATNGTLQIDDIYLDYSTCKPPTALVSAQITSTSAIISWTAPSPAAGNGYQYLYMPTASVTAQPLNTTLPTGSTSAGVTLMNLLGLTPSTSYSYWVRSDCGGGDVSQWTLVGTFTTLVQPVYCIPSNGLTTSYFNNFTTTGGIANISNASGFSTAGYGSYVSQIVSQSVGSSISFSCGLTGTTVGVALWVDWNNDGTFSTAERMYNTGTYVSAASGTFAVPAGQALGDYRMRIVMDWLATSPAPCAFSGAGEAEDYTFRVLTPPPPISISGTSYTLCAGDTTGTVTITSPLSNFQVYDWSPSSGVSGSVATGFTFTPSVTTVYTLTGTQTTGNFSSNTVKYTVIATPLPTPIVITPSSLTRCQNDPPTALVATGGIVNGQVLWEENFNGATNSFTTVNNSFNGSPAIAAWTLRPSPYVRGGAITSNDNSQFYFSDSDLQGSAGTTNTELISPIFSLVSPVTDASLSFYHYYRGWGSGTASVQISTNGGVSYSPMPGASWTTTPTAGPPVTLSQVTISLSAYVGLNNLRIKFTYLNANWGWYWAIDNVKVTTSQISEVLWSPLTGLYSNAAGTIAYNGAPASVVYAKPNTSITYNTSADSPEGCTTYTDVPVTVKPINAGVASSNQTVCSAPANLTLTGFVGTVSTWQYSTTLAFTTPINIPSTASSTLLSAQMAVGATLYYRAVVTNNGCTAYSNVITINYINSTWNGTTWSNGVPTNTTAAFFSGNYTSTGDLSACSVAVLSGNVTFNSGHSLIVQNAVNVSGGTLTFENNASLVQINNASVNVGNINYKRNTTPVKRFDFTYWSTPVAVQTLSALSPNTLSDKYFSFDASVGNWAMVPATTTMLSGKGYIVRSPNDFDITTPAVYNAVFVGVPNNGIINTPIVGANSFNLIGNPYPSALNINTFFDANGITTGTGVTDKTIYLWTHNTPVTTNAYLDNDYATYNYMGGVGTAAALNSGVNNTAPLGKVASGQSFFIKGLTNGNAIFNNAMRVSGNNSQFFKTTNNTSDDRSRVWLEMFNSQGAYKQTLVGYTAAATNNYDSGYDGELLDGGTAIAFYSTLSSMNLVIQGKGLPFTNQDIVPLGYQVTTAGTYEMKLSNFDGIFDTQNVYVEDKLLNVIHNLKESNYSFATNVGTFDTRFVLRYTNSSALQTASNLFNEDSVVAYKDIQGIHINSGVTNMDEISIYDVRGSLFYTKKGIQATNFSITNLLSSQQMILIQITSIDGRVVTKKLIF